MEDPTSLHGSATAQKEYLVAKRLPEVFTHQLNHCGQVNLLLRRCGVEPPESDILDGVVHP